MNVLVGYTGFVGSNIMKHMAFDHVFNSKNITQAYGLEPELLIYAGIRAEKFFADQNPEIDLAHIEEAILNIEQIKPKQLVLISTVDVYANPVNVNENTLIEDELLTPYGRNRRHLERSVMERFENVLIVRLPALFGDNIKKNFLYDYIHFIPTLLNESKYKVLSEKDHRIATYYKLEQSGFYRCQAKSDSEREDLIDCLKCVDFSALCFTDSRSIFQFYNLAYLAQHIQLGLEHELKVMNMATEPVSAGELYKYLTGEDFINETDGKVFYYDFKTKHSEIFHGIKGYIFTKQTVLENIKTFVEERKYV